MTAAGTGECVHSAANGDCYRSGDCPELATCSVDTPTETVCEPLVEGYDVYAVCYEVATPPLSAGVCATRLGTPCQTTEDCDEGICVEIEPDVHRCTGWCDALSPTGDQNCQDRFDEPTAVCCYSSFAGDICLYYGDGFYCDWSP